LLFLPDLFLLLLLLLMLAVNVVAVVAVAVVAGTEYADAAYGAIVHFGSVPPVAAETFASWEYFYSRKVIPFPKQIVWQWDDMDGSPS